jgi:DNA-directed RNA polymerase subunit beta'
MGHIELAVPVLHAWYKSSPSGGVNQLLGLSANEIDKVLSFVKYILVQKADADFKKKIIVKIKEDYDAKLKELQELYKSELAENKENPKQVKEIERLVEENKESLEKEFNRIKSIVSDLEVGSTIFENDFRHIFAKYTTLAVFQS